MRAAISRFFTFTVLLVSGLLAGCGGSCLGCGGDGAGGTQPPAGTPPPVVVMQSFAYVANEGLSTIGIYRIEDNGALVSVDIALAQENVRFVAIHPSNRFAYAVDRGVDMVFTYQIDPSTGRLTDRVEVATGQSPQVIRVHPSGNFAYVTNSIDGTVSIYDVDAGTGALTSNPAGPVTVGAEPSGIIIDPTGRILFVESADGVRSYSIDASGALSSISTVPIAATLNDVGLAPSGRFLYAAAADGTVSMHAISATGDVGPGTVFTVGGIGEQTIYVEPKGRFAYVTNRGDNRVAAFGLHPQTGDLIPAGAVIVADPGSVAMGPTGEYLYASSQDDHTVFVYRVDQNTGALSAAPGAMLVQDSNPIGIAITSFPR